MTEATTPNMVLPKPLFVGLAALLIATIVGIGMAGGNKIQPQVAVQSLQPALQQSVWLRFSDQANGSVLVSDPVSDNAIEEFAPNTNHFARGVLRGLGRERRKRGETMVDPFELGHNALGQLALRDPLTDNLIVVAAFGSVNEAVFAHLYELAQPRAQVAALK